MASMLCMDSPVRAQSTNVVTDPVGFITLNVEGTNTGVRYSFLGLGLTQAPSNRGIVSGVSGTHIMVGDTLTAGQFNQTITGTTTNPVAFIEITSGSKAGLMDDIVSNDTANVFTASDISSLVSSGQTYKIYPHWTIGTVFGATNDVGLTGLTSSADSDNITVLDPRTQRSVTYYYKGGGIGAKGWRAVGSSDNQSNAVLYVDQGFYILRQPVNPVTISLKLVGGVKLGQTIIPVAAADNFVANVYPATTTLGASGLYTTNAVTGLLGASSSADSDNVEIWNQSLQKWDTYYYKATGIGTKGWRLVGASSEASTNTINSGTMMHIRRLGSTGFNWFAQQPFTLE